MIDGLAGEKEPLGDIGATQTVCDHHEHLDLAAGQTRSVVLGRSARPAAKATDAALVQPADHDAGRGRVQSLKLGQRLAQGRLVTRLASASADSYGRPIFAHDWAARAE
jgi:hypothetical protein